MTVAVATRPDVTKAAVLAAVSAVPEGRVTTYRDLGARLGVSAREVAFQLGQLTPEEADDMPWHRAVGDDGWLGAPKGDAAGRSQEDRLSVEGVKVWGGRVEAFEDVRLPADELAGV